VNEDIIKKIMEALKDDGVVPMPNGHGVLCRPQRCVRLAASPGAPVRSVVLHAMLGKAGEKRLGTKADDDKAKERERIERWIRDHWADYASAWFDIHSPEDGWPADLRSQEHGSQERRWRYILEAQSRLIAQLAAERDGGLDIERDEWYREEAARLMGQLQRDRANTKPAQRRQRGAVPRSVSLHPPEDLLWANVSTYLQDPKKSVIVRMMYFMHVLHCLLGVEQPPLDKAYEDRRELYSKVAGLLRRSDGGSGCRFSAEARDIGECLRGTALLSHSAADAAVRTAEAAARLPDCFRPNEKRRAPPSRALVSALVGDERAAELLRPAHDLAEAVADHLLDPLRIRTNKNVQGLMAEETAYLYNKARTRAYGTDYAPRMRFALSPEKRTDLAQIASHELGALAAAGVYRAQWSPESDPQPCALCHVDAVGAPQ